ncbi:MAG: 3-keto-5-aminohexanoate cleavage protein [Betaproteobacteria bacterium]|nr:3-keto-5-aminohexanoate cleavage protein [Betaproteobacteria bacterium]
MEQTTDSGQDASKTWIEVALNGPWGRDRQPKIPITDAEIIAEGAACVRAGAAIVHLHAYDETTGRQKDDWETYARLIEGIRSQVDAIVYPTIPFAGDRDARTPMSPVERYGHIAELAKRGLLEWAVVDPGSTNITHWNQLTADEPGFVYANPEEHIRYALGLARQYHFHPAYAIYEPGFLRLGAGLHWRCSSPAPIYRFMFTSDYSFGFPPEDFAVTAYLNLMDRIAPGAQWMVGGLGVDALPLIPRAVMEGGHIRVGLEDAPFGCGQSNVELVNAAVERIGNMGSEPASAVDVRNALKTTD